MINQRKRNLVVIIFSIFMITKVFSMEQVATTYKTNLTPTDMVEIFLETISHYAKYSYQIWDYEVYTKDDQQNYAWSVYTDDKGYTTNKYIVKESSVYLYLKNGWIAFYTFGGETTLKSKVCLNVNEGDNYTKIYNSCKNAIMNYRAEGEKWLI